ncbi:MAG: transposase, partial [Roseomonas sp.]|nr:transposase [Roseomonas sp.]
MWSSLLSLDLAGGLSRQMALRQAVVAAIGQGRLAPGQHLPLNRQSESYTREGVELSVSTLADWVGTAA